MKKLILFFVLILGFVSEIKAQFPASSEIYYYVRIDDDPYNGIYVVWVRFRENRVYQSGRFDVKDMEFVKDVERTLSKSDAWYYDKRISNEKYRVYKWWNQDWDNYLAFSKDREELIEIGIAPITGSVLKDYLKRVTLKELESMLKPKFDFLE